jgi:hypothetical protein
MATSMERHAADYILRHLKDKAFASARKLQLEHWRQHYGEQFAKQVEKIVRSEWKARS